MMSGLFFNLSRISFGFIGELLAGFARASQYMATGSPDRKDRKST